MMVLWVACAGSLGAVCRFVLDGAIKQRRGTRFPWATVVINLSGSLILGFVTGLVLFHSADENLQAIVGAGFCGGYTTFSTASFETVRLIQQGRYRAGIGNAAGTLLTTLTAAAAGLTAAAGI